jgi:hypothetical protein
MKQVRAAFSGCLFRLWIERRRVDPSPAIVDLDEIYMVKDILTASQGVKDRLSFGAFGRR